MQRLKAALGVDMTGESANENHDAGCEEALAEWYDQNKDAIFIEDDGTFAESRSLVNKAFRAGWAAHKAANVWE